MGQPQEVSKKTELANAFYPNQWWWHGLANSDTLRDGLSWARTQPGVGEIFRTRPDQSGSPTYPVQCAASLLLGFQAAEAWRWPPIRSNAEVKERVELYVYTFPLGLYGIFRVKFFFFFSFLMLYHGNKWVPVTVMSESLSQWWVSPCHSDKWVPVTVISGSLSPWHGVSSGCEWRNGFQIWRVAANILNKQSRIADKGWSSSLWVGRGAKTYHLTN